MATTTVPAATGISFLPQLTADSSTGHLLNASIDYTDNHVNHNLHPAFSDSGIAYSPNGDCFLDDSEHFDEQPLRESQSAFAEALRNYEENASRKFKTSVDLRKCHDWQDVIAQVEKARSDYSGMGKEGIMRSIRSGFRSFNTAAPAVQAWLKLLPSTSIYGSVFCGGLTLILEAGIRIGKLREDTYEALDQIPLQIEKAQTLTRTYSCSRIKKQAAHLYCAILDCLQHILAWYQRKACKKYIGSFGKGPAYAATLQEKMGAVVKSSQTIDNQAGVKQHVRLHEIQQVTWQTRSQLTNVEKHTEELKVLTLEARNHLYAIFRDTEAWQEAMQGWAASWQAKKSRRRSETLSALEQQERNLEAREALLETLGHDQNDLASNVEDALRQIGGFPLVDQDRAIAVLQHKMVEDWLVSPNSGAILVHGNGRRHDPISPTSAASAMLIHILSNTMSFITLYWFCGSHVNGPNGNASGMIRSFICQLLSNPHLRSHPNCPRNVKAEDLKTLLRLFTSIIQQLPERTIVICAVDAVSYYEGDLKGRDTCTSLQKIIKFIRTEPLILKLFVTSPTRTSSIHRKPSIAKHLTVVEIPQHINGGKVGFNHRAMVSSTERTAQRLSEGLKRG